MIQRIIAATLALFALGAALWFGGSVAAQSAAPQAACARPTSTATARLISLISSRSARRSARPPRPPPAAST